MYYTYIIRCEDNSLYTGITNNIDRRINEHFTKGKKCAKYTLNHQAIKLEAYWKSNNRILATKLEYHIKKLSKIQKEDLIEKNNLQILKEKINYKEYQRINLPLK